MDIIERSYTLMTSGSYRVKCNYESKKIRPEIHQSYVKCIAKKIAKIISNQSVRTNTAKKIHVSRYERLETHPTTWALSPSHYCSP